MTALRAAVAIRPLSLGEGTRTTTPTLATDGPAACGRRPAAGGFRWSFGVAACLSDGRASEGLGLAEASEAGWQAASPWRALRRQGRDAQSIPLAIQPPPPPGASSNSAQPPPEPPHPPRTHAHTHPAGRAALLFSLFSDFSPAASRGLAPEGAFGGGLRRRGRFPRFR